MKRCAKCDFEYDDLYDACPRCVRAPEAEVVVPARLNGRKVVWFAVALLFVAAAVAVMPRVLGTIDALRTDASPVTGAGWGSVRIGATVPDVEAALGPHEFHSSEFDDGSAFYNYPSKGIQVLFGEPPDPRVIYVFFYMNDSVEYEVDLAKVGRFEGATDKGIDRTSTPEDVLAAYGPPVADDTEYLPARSISYLDISFQFDGNTLAHIRAGRNHSPG